MSFVKSLRELAIMACLKNIRDIDNIGFLSYETVRDILVKIDNAAQLRQIELNSPQIEGQTAEIWLKLIERDFPPGIQNQGISAKGSQEMSENKLKSALAGLRQDKEKNTSKIVSGKALPSSAKFAIRRYTGPREGSSNALTFGGGSRTKTANGASVMRKVRREVKEIANIHGSLSRPIKAPSKRPVMKAPVAMVNDHKRAAQPAYRPATKEPAKMSHLEAALEEFERRATFVSDSEGEDDGDDDHDALPKAKQAAAKAAPKTPTSSLQRKFGGFKPSVKPATITRAPESKPAKDPQKTSPSLLPQTRTTPPMDEGSSPQSVEELLEAIDAKHQAAAAPAPAPRKRKAVDIFMRPKRRM
ncbi:hypothetical protein TrVGV298_009100 [Trichoderma virens]|nr:hypothetical protein TrVGV298_009100 [Trichoderma virens]